MGESGENSDQWIETFRTLLEKNGISWAFWPYKKMNSDSCIRKFNTPNNWAAIVKFVEGDRSSTTKVAQSRPAFSVIDTSFKDFIMKIQFNNTVICGNYIKALGLNP